MANPVHKDVRSADEVDAFAGAKMRFRRKELDMTQEQLADACGISFQQIQKYENGANRTSLSRLFQIAKVLKVPVDYFFPEGEIEPLRIDPVQTAARRIYETARRLSGNKRPMWEALNPEDAFDQAMREVAFAAARDELGVSEAA